MTIWDYMAQNPGWALIFLLAGTISAALLLSAVTYGVQKAIMVARIPVDELPTEDDG